MFRFRHIKTHKEGTTNLYVNTNSLDEVTVYYSDDSIDCESFSDIEINIDGEWKSAVDAAKDKDIIPDNLNTYYDKPHSDEEFEQGFNW